MALSAETKFFHNGIHCITQFLCMLEQPKAIECFCCRVNGNLSCVYTAPKFIRIEFGLYPEWLNLDRMWIRRAHIAKFIPHNKNK